MDKVIQFKMIAQLSMNKYYISISINYSYRNCKLIINVIQLSFEKVFRKGNV